METLIGLKDEIKKLFLVYFIPGTLSAWPWIYIIAKFFVDHPIINQELLKDYGTILYIITLFFFYGSGHIVAKLGARLEVLLEKIIYDFVSIRNWKKFACDQGFRVNKKNEMKATREKFNNTWYNYLKIDYSKSEKPLLVRYYDEFIIGLKFEFNCVISIPIMVLSLVYLENNGFLSIMTTNNLFTFSFVFTILWLYLIYEATRGISVAHELREKIIEKFDSKPF